MDGDLAGIDAVEQEQAWIRQERLSLVAKANKMLLASMGLPGQQTGVCKLGTGKIVMPL